MLGLRRMRGLLTAVRIVAVNVVLACLLGELIVRIHVATVGGNLLTQDSTDVYRFEPSRDYGRLWTNRYGYASREFETERRPGTVRLALIGDSFAVGAVRQDDNFASWMERLHPGLEVYNFGVSAISPDAYAAILKGEALRFSPDVVLVAFFVGNDITGPPDPQRPFWSPILPVFVRRTWRLGREWFRLEFESPPALALPQLAHPSVPQKGFNLSKATYLEVEIERLAVSRRSQQEAMDPFWQGALKYLREMRDETRRHRAEFAIVFIPDEYQVNPDLRDNIVSVRGIPVDDIDLQLPQRKLGEFCTAEGIRCLDLLPVFTSEPDTYLPQDTHWNEKGNRIAGERIVAWLAESDLLSAR